MGGYKSIGQRHIHGLDDDASDDDASDDDSGAKLGPAGKTRSLGACTDGYCENHYNAVRVVLSEMRALRQHSELATTALLPLLDAAQAPDESRRQEQQPPAHSAHEEL